LLTNAVNLRREGFTPEPESPEERDAGLRILESEARKLLVKDGCPPCHPADLPCPLREPDIPEHLKDILKYFGSTNPSGFLNSQLHEWREFRQYQAWERQRYGPRKFHRYVERLHECLQEHQIGCDADAVNLRLDAREQGPFDNWIEYQYRQLVCLRIFERKRDQAAAAEELKGPQQLPGDITRLELATRNLERHKLLLPWIQQERRAMEENPQLLAAQPNVRSDDEGADDDDDDLDEVVREYVAVQKEEGRVDFLKEAVLWARNSMKPYRRPRHANTDDQQGGSLPAVEGATGATSVRDGEPDSAVERDNNVPPAETTDEGPAASEAGQTPHSRGQDGDAAAPSADDRNKSPVTQNAEEAPGETVPDQTADGQDGQAAVPLVEDTQSSRQQTRAATTKSRNRRRQQDEQTAAPAAPAAPTPAVAPAKTTQSSRRRTRAATTKSRKRGRQQDEDEEAEEAEQDNPAPAKKKRAKQTTKRATPRRQQEIAPVPVAVAVPPARKEVRTRSGRISRPPERWVPTF
jgi:hypothetical protein